MAPFRDCSTGCAATVQRLSTRSAFGRPEVRQTQARPGPLPPVSVAGQPLPSDVKAKMEAAFGHSFADVRVHHGTEAESIGAVAFTRGTHIHFARRAYQPQTPAGQRLLGHELAHVVQQRARRVARPAGGVPINDDPALECEAEAAGARAAEGRPAGMLAAEPSGALPAAPAVQCARDGVWRHRSTGAHNWTNDQNTHPDPLDLGWQWFSKDAYLQQFAPLRTRCDTMFDPTNGAKYYQSRKAKKLYTTPLNVLWGVEKSSLKSAHDYAEHTDVASGKRYYSKHADSSLKLYDDPDFKTETQPQPDATKLVKHPDHMLGPDNEDVYASDSDDYYGTKPDLAIKPPPRSELWDATREEDLSRGAHVTVKDLQMVLDNSREGYTPSPSHVRLTEKQIQYARSPDPTGSNEHFDILTGRSIHRSESDTLYENMATRVYPDPKSLNKKRSLEEAVDIRTGRQLYGKNDVFYVDSLATVPSNTPSKFIKRNPVMRTDNNSVTYYESPSGMFFSTPLKMLVPQPRKEQLLNLERPDRIRLPGEGATAFKTRIGGTKLWDVGSYKDLRDGGPPPNTDCDHIIASAAVKQKVEKDSKNSYMFQIPARRSLAGLTGDEAHNQGLAQAIPRDVHVDYSRTHSSRNTRMGELEVGGVTKQGKRPEIDSEVPASAAHADTEALLEGLRKIGRLGPKSWGGKLIHMRMFYEPKSGMTDRTAPAFEFEELPSPKKGEPYFRAKEVPGETQIQRTNELFISYLQAMAQNHGNQD